MTKPTASAVVGRWLGHLVAALSGNILALFGRSLSKQRPLKSKARLPPELLFELLQCAHQGQCSQLAAYSASLPILASMADERCAKIAKQIDAHQTAAKKNFLEGDHRVVNNNRLNWDVIGEGGLDNVLFVCTTGQFQVQRVAAEMNRFEIGVESPVCCLTVHPEAILFWKVAKNGLSPRNYYTLMSSIQCRRLTEIRVHENVEELTFVTAYDDGDNSFNRGHIWTSVHRRFRPNSTYEFSLLKCALQKYRIAPEGERAPVNWWTRVTHYIFGRTMFERGTVLPMVYVPLATEALVLRVYSHIGRRRNSLE